MKRAFSDIQRDEDGRLIVGSPDVPCKFCGAEAIPTLSENDQLVWWHPPGDCCNKTHSSRRDKYPSAAGPVDVDYQHTPRGNQ